MKIVDGEKNMTLEELAQKLCQYVSGVEAAGCYDGSCPAADLCRHKRNGMVELLRKVVEK